VCQAQPVAYNASHSSASLTRDELRASSDETDVEAAPRGRGRVASRGESRELQHVMTPCTVVHIALRGRADAYCPTVP
jgi:hypothetical protein